MRKTLSPLRVALAEGLGHETQRVVAGLVAVEVVDLLEVVDVEEQHAERARRGDLLLEHLVEDAMAEQSGQRVVARLLPALLVEQRLVERQRPEAHEVQQQLMLLGPDRRGAGDRDDADRLVGDLEREALPAVVEQARAERRPP